MSEIDAAKVKELRERTGAGMMDAKKALIEVKGDMEKALADCMADESVRKQIDNLGIEPIWRDGKAYAALLKKIETELVPILRETGMAKKPA